MCRIDTDIGRVAAEGHGLVFGREKLHQGKKARRVDGSGVGRPNVSVIDLKDCRAAAKRKRNPDPKTGKFHEGEFLKSGAPAEQASKGH